MGEVYEAEELESGRHIALKVLSRSLGMPTDHARFIREGRLAAGISHPHTIYIYGTDEIQGIPVIAMELAPGGTLKDVVKARGSLPPTQAVDVILQVVAGLEAAADAGVLHRDVKPSNCFIDSDGTVKVGDFGLSISMLTTDERSLTMLGTVIGTPAFASPEQLRGDDLDVRSDIYSVGATLYYMLTGRSPFEDTNVIRLVTQVAQEMPASPRAIQPGIPKELAAVVMRCLAKRASERYASYDDLRAVLKPFSATAPRAASPGIRFVAGFVDHLILMMIALPILTWLWEPFVPGQREGMVSASLVTWLVDIAYYGVLEGRWGRALGKQLFGLRVIDAARQRPGIPRALVRASAWTIGTSGPILAYGYLMAPLMAAAQNTPLGAFFGFSFPILTLLASGAMFITARRSNGYTGLHDLATATRVVMTRSSEGRERAASRIADEPTSTGSDRVGPYVMVGERPLDASQVNDVLVGYDDRLRRKVWIRPAQHNAPQVQADRRTLSRPTRLRWLSGRRNDSEAWDAYEAADGQPLLSLFGGRPHSWSAVRVWLADLAAEIRAGLADGSLPPLTLNRVWITNGGRAKLLDWPTVRTTEEAAISPDLGEAQAFLHEVGKRALISSRPAEADGSSQPAIRRHRGIDAPVPLGARAFFDRLEDRSFNDADALAGEAAALVDEPAAFPRGRRLAHLVACGLPAVLGSLLLAVVTLLVMNTAVRDAAVFELNVTLDRLNHLTEHPEEAKPGERRAFQLYVAGKYRARIEDPATWSQSWSPLRFRSSSRAEARQALAAHPAPAPNDVRAAEAVVGPHLDRARTELDGLRAPSGAAAMLLLFWSFVCAIVGSVGLLSAFIFRGGLALRLFGAAVVKSQGGDLGRFRAAWRALIGWLPAALAAAGAIVAPDPFTSDLKWMILSALAVVLFLVGAAYAVRHPDRGIQDRVAGTALVPR